MVKTTNEWICDRCGEKIGNRSIYMFSVHPGKKLLRWDHEFGGYKPLDICKKCELEFKEWWKGSNNG